MRKLLSFLIPLAVLCSGASLDPQWFVENWSVGQYGSSIGCYQPANVSVDPSIGLILTSLYVPAGVSCGNGTDALTTTHYTSAAITMNKPSDAFTYGVISYQASMPTSGGPWPAIWLLGFNCQLWEKLLASPGGCPAANNAPGWTEIDMTEILNSNTSVNQQIHVGTGSHVDGCTAMPAAWDKTQLHTYTTDWEVGTVRWYIDGTLTCTVTEAYVPSSNMVLILGIAIGGAGGGTINSGVFPQAMKVRFIRVCKPGTSRVTCETDPTAATVFDDEFTGTAPLSSVYVGESFTGNMTGLDPANTFGVLNNQQVSWINDPGYWQGQGGVSQIGPGTFLKLVGSFSSTLTAYGSGTGGSPITFDECGATGTPPTIDTNGQTNIAIVTCDSGVGGNGVFNTNVAIH